MIRLFSKSRQPRTAFSAASLYGNVAISFLLIYLPLILLHFRFFHNTIYYGWYYLSDMNKFAFDSFCLISSGSFHKEIVFKAIGSLSFDFLALGIIKVWCVKSVAVVPLFSIISIIPVNTKNPTPHRFTDEK